MKAMNGTRQIRSNIAVADKPAVSARTRTQFAFGERVRLIETMVLSLIVLTVIGVMLSAFTMVLIRTQDTAQRGTARTLYMAAQDYTARQLNAGVDMKSLKDLNENSAFFKEYVSGPIKGRLKVHLTEQGAVKRIEYTENGNTIIIP